MNGDHPWRDWLNVLVIFSAGLIVVMMVVRLLIKWAQRAEKPTDKRDDEHWREVERARGERDDDRPKGGTDKHTP